MRKALQDITGTLERQTCNSFLQAIRGGDAFGDRFVRQQPPGGSIQGFGVEQIFIFSQRYPELLTVQ